MTDEDATVLLHEQAAVQMATFWDRVLTEFNVSKALKGDADAQALPCPEKGTTASERNDPLHGLYDLCEEIGRRQQMGKAAERQAPSPECLSYETLMHCLLESGECVPECAEPDGWNLARSLTPAAGPTRQHLTREIRGQALPVAKWNPHERGRSS